MYSHKIDIGPYVGTRIVTFINDPVMRKHTAITLKHMGFTNVNEIDVPHGYFNALNKIVPIVSGDADLVLLNFPPKPQAQGTKGELVTVYDTIDDNYRDMQSLLAKRKVDPLSVLSKTIPLIEVGDYLRDKLIEVLVKYRVPSAFFMTAPMVVKKSETAARKEWKTKKNIELFYMELSSYLNYYFRDRDELVTLIDDKLTEKDLTERKKQYDQFMIQSNEAKEKGDIDQAIALLRQAIDIFPQDIDAFMESGRLYVRKREYGRALIRYGQAEDLFEEAPEPNKEIGNLRLTQVKDKIKGGLAPDSKEITELLAEAVSNFKTSLGKAADLEAQHSGGKDQIQHESVTSIATDILKWNLGPLLGPKHPALKELMGVVQESTAKLDQIPLDQLTGSQCLAMALNAWQKGELASAEMYYFQAVKDSACFVDACSEINKMGMRLRKMGRVDIAIDVYEKLLRVDPPNHASVYMNMAIAFAAKNAPLDSSGYVTRCLTIDPDLAKEPEFYSSMLPSMVPLLIRLLKVALHIIEGAKQIKPAPGLVKLMEAKERLAELIAGNQRSEAFRLFLMIHQKAPKFTTNPEFFCDGVVVRFLNGIRASLANNPKQQNNLKIILKWMQDIKKIKVPKNLANYQKLIRSATAALEEDNDNHQAAFLLGKALILMPESYYDTPYFYLNKRALALVRELSYKFRYLNPDYFPEYRKDEESGQTKVRLKKKIASPNNVKPTDKKFTGSDLRQAG